MDFSSILGVTQLTLRFIHYTEALVTNTTRRLPVTGRLPGRYTVQLRPQHQRLTPSRHLNSFRTDQAFLSPMSPASGPKNAFLKMAHPLRTSVAWPFHASKSEADVVLTLIPQFCRATAGQHTAKQNDNSHDDGDYGDSSLFTISVSDFPRVGARLLPCPRPW